MSLPMNPLRKLEFQDNPGATQTNLKQIKQRFDELVAHIGTKIATATQVSNNTSNITNISAELAQIEAEITALQGQLSGIFGESLLFTLMLMGA